MSNILFATDLSFGSLVRGTPIRVYHLLKELNKYHKIFVCAEDIPDKLDTPFIKYPQYSGIKKLRFFNRLVNEKNIEIVMTSTEIGLKLPVILKLLNGIDIVVEKHGLWPEELYYRGAISWLKKQQLDYSIKFLLPFYDLVGVVSTKLKSYYQGWNSNIQVVPGGVKQNKIGRYKRFSDDEFTIGYMGNIRSYQGFEHLLEAASELKNEQNFDFSLNLILSGEKNKITSLIKETDLMEQIKLHINVHHSKVYKIISHSDVLVIPRESHKMTEYAFPSKLPDYLATGIPVIATKVGPVNELFVQKDIGIFIKADKIKDRVKKAIYQVKNMSPAERKKMGDQAKKIVRNELTWEKIGRNFSEMIEKI